MPPTRTENKGKGKRRDKPAPADDANVGVQKIKSAIRQTKRLLAKDNLDAGVRITTERRLIGLEEQIKKAQSTQKERKFATKYHMVKFFDKKKVLRKIKQLKKQLEANPSDNELMGELTEKRVELNYIVHFPLLEKYISLYPSSSNQSTKGKGKFDETTSRTDERRDEIRSRIREEMGKGGISAEPEMDEHVHMHEHEGKSEKKVTGSATGVDDLGAKGKKKKGKHKSQHELVRVNESKRAIDSVLKPPLKKASVIEKDDFFGED